MAHFTHQAAGSALPGREENRRGQRFPAARRAAGTGIRLLIADVDGTLLGPDKTLGDEVVRAVSALRSAGVSFALASSRPPRGMAMLLDPLRICTPFCAFNGGLILRAPDLRIHASPLLPHAAQAAVDFLHRHKIETRVFDASDWYVLDPTGAFAVREHAALRLAPRRVSSFAAATRRAFKIVGASTQHDLIAWCERELRQLLGETVAVTRSRPHYIDITDRRAHKGRFVHALSRLLSIPRSAIAAIGDGVNDLPMFEEAGLSIAMGNAEEVVRAAAGCVTGTNAENGFAAAVRRDVLGRGALRLAS